MHLEHYIDHTLLKPTAKLSDVIHLCVEAKTNGLYAVCVNSCNVPLAKKELEESEVKLAAVIGFPLGAMATDSKVAEALYCIRQGADEIGGRRGQRDLRKDTRQHRRAYVSALVAELDADSDSSSSESEDEASVEHDGEEHFANTARFMLAGLKE